MHAYNCINVTSLSATVLPQMLKRPPKDMKFTPQSFHDMVAIIVIATYCSRVFGYDSNPSSFFLII